MMPQVPSPVRPHLLKVPEPFKSSSPVQTRELGLRRVPILSHNKALGFHGKVVLQSRRSGALSSEGVFNGGGAAGTGWG